MSTYSWHNYYLTLEGIWAFVKKVSTHTLSFGSPVNIMYNMGTIWMSSTCLLPILLCFSRLLYVFTRPPPPGCPGSVLQRTRRRIEGKWERNEVLVLVVGSALARLTTSLILMPLLACWSSYKFSLTLLSLSSIILRLETTSQFDILEYCQSLSIGLPSVSSSCIRTLSSVYLL